MLASILKTYKMPDLDHLKSGINEILEPFCSLDNFDYIDFDSGKEAVEYLDKENKNFAWVPSSIIGIMQASPTCILQQFRYKSILWFFARLKKRVRSSSLWVIRNWEFISAEYVLNEQGHVVDPNLVALLTEKTGKVPDIRSVCVTKTYTPTEVADDLQMCRTAVYSNLLLSGVIPSYKEGSASVSPVYVSEYWLAEYKQQKYWAELNKIQPLDRYSHAFGNWENFDLD